jgi:hypothetical protein
MTEGLAAELRCCKFAPVSCLALEPCFLMEKKEVDLCSQARGLICSTQEYLILCVKMHLTKEFSFTGNQHFTMLQISPLYVLYFLAFYSFQATVHAVGAHFRRQFYRNTL